MSTISKFESDRIQKLRQQALEAWQEQVPEDTPQGWSKSPVDFTPFLALFPSLRLKAGYVLRAYQFRERNDANGKVWAMPENAPFPDPEKYLAGDPPPPPDALDDLMQAITGDGTAWSYLNASLFARELAEFGAFGHGQYWSAFHILGSNPWDSPDPSGDASPRTQPTGSADEWQWSEPEPSDWSPTVSMDQHTVTVTFYTFCGLGSQRITRHIDTYTQGQYSFIADEQPIASGPRGFVW